MLVSKLIFSVHLLPIMKLYALKKHTTFIYNPVFSKQASVYKRFQIKKDNFAAKSCVKLYNGFPYLLLSPYTNLYPAFSSEAGLKNPASLDKLDLCPSFWSPSGTSKEQSSINAPRALNDLKKKRANKFVLKKNNKDLNHNYIRLLKTRYTPPLCSKSRLNVNSSYLKERSIAIKKNNICPIFLKTPIQLLQRSWKPSLLVSEGDGHISSFSSEAGSPSFWSPKETGTYVNPATALLEKAGKSWIYARLLRRPKGRAKKRSKRKGIKTLNYCKTFVELSSNTEKPTSFAEPISILNMPFRHKKFQKFLTKNLQQSSFFGDFLTSFLQKNSIKLQDPLNYIKKRSNKNRNFNVSLNKSSRKTIVLLGMHPKEHNALVGIPNNTTALHLSAKSVSSTFSFNASRAFELIKTNYKMKEKQDKITLWHNTAFYKKIISFPSSGVSNLIKYGFYFYPFVAVIAYFKIFAFFYQIKNSIFSYSQLNFFFNQSSKQIAEILNINPEKGHSSLFRSEPKAKGLELMPSEKLSIPFGKGTITSRKSSIKTFSTLKGPEIYALVKSIDTRPSISLYSYAVQNSNKTRPILMQLHVPKWYPLLANPFFVDFVFSTVYSNKITPLFNNNVTSAPLIKRGVPYKSIEKNKLFMFNKGSKPQFYKTQYKANEFTKKRSFWGVLCNIHSYNHNYGLKPYTQIQKKQYTLNSIPTNNKTDLSSYNRSLDKKLSICPIFLKNPIQLRCCWVYTYARRAKKGIKRSGIKGFFLKDRQGVHKKAFNIPVFQYEKATFNVENIIKIKTLQFGLNFYNFIKNMPVLCPPGIYVNPATAFSSLYPKEGLPAFCKPRNRAAGDVPAGYKLDKMDKMDSSASFHSAVLPILADQNWLLSPLKTKNPDLNPYMIEMGKGDLYNKKVLYCKNKPFSFLQNQTNSILQMSHPLLTTGVSNSALLKKAAITMSSNAPGSFIQRFLFYDPKERTALFQQSSINAPGALDFPKASTDMPFYANSAELIKRGVPLLNRNPLLLFPLYKGECPPRSIHKNKRQGKTFKKLINTKTYKNNLNVCSLKNRFLSYKPFRFTILSVDSKGHSERNFNKFKLSFNHLSCLFADVKGSTENLLISQTRLLLTLKRLQHLLWTVKISQFMWFVSLLQPNAIDNIEKVTNNNFRAIAAPSLWNLLNIKPSLKQTEIKFKKSLKKSPLYYNALALRARALLELRSNSRKKMSFSSLIKHKKFFTKFPSNVADFYFPSATKRLKKLKPNFYKLFYNYSSLSSFAFLLNKPLRGLKSPSFWSPSGMGEETTFKPINGFEKPLKEILQNRKIEQKDFRTKKLNLESRRQQKRKRFYPRPNWIRVRMFEHTLFKHFSEAHNQRLSIEPLNPTKPFFLVPFGVSSEAGRGLICKPSNSFLQRSWRCTRRVQAVKWFKTYKKVERNMYKNYAFKHFLDKTLKSKNLHISPATLDIRFSRETNKIDSNIASTSLIRSIYALGHPLFNIKSRHRFPCAKGSTLVIKRNFLLKGKGHHNAQKGIKKNKELRKNYFISAKLSKSLINFIYNKKENNVNLDSTLIEKNDSKTLQNKLIKGSKKQKAFWVWFYNTFNNFNFLNFFEQKDISMLRVFWTLNKTHICDLASFENQDANLLRETWLFNKNLHINNSFTYKQQIQNLLHQKSKKKKGSQKNLKLLYVLYKKEQNSNTSNALRPSPSPLHRGTKSKGTKRKSIDPAFCKPRNSFAVAGFTYTPMPMPEGHGHGLPAKLDKLDKLDPETFMAFLQSKDLPEISSDDQNKDNTLAATTSALNTFSERNKIWMTQKKRNQCKNNKTKAILQAFLKKFHNVANYYYINPLVYNFRKKEQPTKLKNIFNQLNKSKTKPLNILEQNIYKAVREKTNLFNVEHKNQTSFFCTLLENLTEKQRQKEEKINYLALLPLPKQNILFKKISNKADKQSNFVLKKADALLLYKPMSSNEAVAGFTYTPLPYCSFFQRSWNGNPYPASLLLGLHICPKGKEGDQKEEPGRKGFYSQRGPKEKAFVKKIDQKQSMPTGIKKIYKKFKLPKSKTVVFHKRKTKNLKNTINFWWCTHKNQNKTHYGQKSYLKPRHASLSVLNFLAFWERGNHKAFLEKNNMYPGSAAKNINTVSLGNIVRQKKTRFNIQKRNSALSLTAFLKQYNNCMPSQPLDSFSNKQSINKLIVAFTLFFHFLSFMVLISISQIRCLIKFNLIVIYKLSKVYADLVHYLYTAFCVSVKPLSHMFLNGTMLYRDRAMVNNPQHKLTDLLRKRPTYKKPYRLNKNIGASTSISSKPINFIKSSIKSPAALKVFYRNHWTASTSKPIKKTFTHKNYKKLSYFNNFLLSQKTIKYKLIFNNLFNLFASRTVFFTFPNRFANLYALARPRRGPKGRAFFSRSYIERGSKTSNSDFFKSTKHISSAFNKQVPLTAIKTSPFFIKSQKKEPDLVKTSVILEPMPFYQNFTVAPRTVAPIVKSGLPFKNIPFNNKKLMTALVKLYTYYNIDKSSFILNNLTNESVNLYVQLSQKNSRLFFQTLLKGIDLLERGFRAICLFFEKPAQQALDWIAYSFLIEWCSDMTSIVPENVDLTIWDWFVKSSRSVKISGFAGNLLQKRFFCLFYAVFDKLTQPDCDLINRQRKGVLFWDIWADILMKEAESRNINISSLTSIKEERTALIDNVLYSLSPDARPLRGPKGRAYEPIIFNSEKKNFDFNNLIGGLQNLYTKKMFYYKRNGTYNQSLSSISNLGSLKRGLSSKPFAVGSLLKSERSFVKNKWNLEKGGELRKKNEKQTIKWNVSQQSSFKQKHTDLFVDLNLCKDFSHISAIKYYSQLQQPLGSLVCQIYSGIFYKQIAKNVLVIGSSGIEKSLLIEAIAGETEIKIMADNAHRYALVNRGLAVGIKLLKDVFDAICLQTPCLFLLEDIHAIGERRPLVISDSSNNENTKKTVSNQRAFVNSEALEVHEKNQVLIEFSKHSLTHYKKPYRGEFSQSIVTNHFCFDLFLGRSIPRTRRTGISLPSAIELKKNTSLDQSSSNASGALNAVNVSNYTETFASCLQLPFFRKDSIGQTGNQSLSPPSTSPFTVLLLKQQQKLKPKKILEEISLAGLPGEQLTLLPKLNYNVRTKVALLADLALSNLSAKLDMITDLLVIIDNVRANRGFVIFATTHSAYSLDPALRRPGRLDETIRVPFISNLWTRWEILKSNMNVFFHLEKSYSVEKIFKVLYQNSMPFKDVYCYISPFGGLDPLGSTYKNVFKNVENLCNTNVSDVPLFKPFSLESNQNMRSLSENTGDTKNVREKKVLTSQKNISLDLVEYVHFDHDTREQYAGPFLNSHHLKKRVSATQAIQNLMLNNVFVEKKIKPLLSLYPTGTYSAFSSFAKYMPYKKPASLMQQKSKNSLLKSERGLVKKYHKKKKLKGFNIKIKTNTKIVICPNTKMFKKLLALDFKRFKGMKHRFINTFFSSVHKKGYKENSSFVKSIRLRKSSINTPAALVLQLKKPFLETGFYKEQCLQKTANKIKQVSYFQSGQKLVTALSPLYYLYNKQLNKLQPPYKKQDKTQTTNVNDPFVGNAIYWNWTQIKLNNRIINPGGVYGKKDLAKEYQIPAEKSNNNSALSRYNPLESLSKKRSIHNNKRASSLGKSTAPLHYASLYENKNVLKQKLMDLIAGKVAESFVFRPPLKLTFFSTCVPSGMDQQKNNKKISFAPEFSTDYGINSSWRAASCLITSFMQKRYIYNKNMVVTALLHFANGSLFGEFRDEPPNPPDSHVFVSAKRYENYKRSVYFQQKKASLDLQSSLKKHEQQRFLKKLYNVPVKNTFGANFMTSFSSVDQKGSTEKAAKITSVSWYYQHKILKRHQFYLTNQWHNAQLPEHNTETVFLSDVDWRYTFIDKLGDLLIDFPDADQIFNPRQRRWLLSSKNSTYMHNLTSNQNIMLQQVYEHFLIEAFTTVYSLLNKNREALDCLVYHFMKFGYVKEINVLNLINNF